MKGSTDHRGTEEHPGRVVTLLSTSEHATFAHVDPHGADDRCYGAVYRIPAHVADSVKAHLDHREKDGYSTFKTRVILLSGEVIEGVTVYTASMSNLRFVGPASVDQMCKEIATRRGPSGWNHEYLVKLWEALRDLDEEDEHVNDLYLGVSRYLSNEAEK